MRQRQFYLTKNRLFYFTSRFDTCRAILVTWIHGKLFDNIISIASQMPGDRG